MEIAVNISVPDEMLADESEKVSRRVLEQFVLEGYKTGKLSVKQVRELLNFSSRIETENFLHRSKAFDYTVEDLKKDFKTMEDSGLK